MAGTSPAMMQELWLCTTSNGYEKIQLNLTGFWPGETSILKVVVDFLRLIYFQLMNAAELSFVCMRAH